MKTQDLKSLAALTDALSSITPTRLDELSNDFTWLSFGRDGTGPKKVRPLIELETSHLENILVTQDQLDYLWKKVILHILRNRYREELIKLYSA